MSRCDVVLVTYGEPPRASFLSQLRYSWRILLGLTRSVAPIPRAMLPVIALVRARLRVKLWKDESYASPLEPLTADQARALERALRSHAPGFTWHVHVAYEFRDPLLPALLDRLPAESPVLVMPMYLADSAFTHELTRRCAAQWSARRGRRNVVVLPPLDEAAIATAAASHIERELMARGILPSPGVALLLAAHGTLLQPPRPIETGRAATERLAAAIGARLESRFGRVQLGWLNHVYGGKWTEPAADVALRDLEREGFRRVAYYPFGFLADNAESQLEGRVALRSAPGLAAAHLPCLNADPDLITVMRDQLIAAVEATRVPAAVNGTADRTTARTA
jgi:protoheme ferro-lyase